MKRPYIVQWHPDICCEVCKKPNAAYVAGILQDDGLEGVGFFCEEHLPENTEKNPTWVEKVKRGDFV